MTLSNLPAVVDQLGVSFSSVLARRDLLSFSISQLNLLKDTCRKISKIDLFDYNYPNNENLTNFLKKGSRVLEESLSLRNTNFSNKDYPLDNLLSSDQKNFKISPNGPKNSDLTRLHRVLNDTLISFFNILGNSGYFSGNLNFLRNILREISIKGLDYSGLVSVVGIINKCDLFRFDDFELFTSNIFSHITRNHKILRYLNDLDTSLLLFHKVSMLYMSRPSFLLSHTPSTLRNIPEELSELLILLQTSIDKVLEILSYKGSDQTNTLPEPPIKSLNNLVQSLFITHNYNKNILPMLPLKILEKLKQILDTNHVNPSSNDSLSQEERGFCDPRGKFTYFKNSIQVNNTSVLHEKIRGTLESVIRSNKDYNSNCKPREGDKNGNLKILSEVRICSSLYFIDLMVTTR